MAIVCDSLRCICHVTYTGAPIVQNKLDCNYCLQILLFNSVAVVFDPLRLLYITGTPVVEKRPCHYIMAVESMTI